MDSEKPITSCDPVLLNRFSDGELEPKDIQLVRAHIDSCEACREVLERNQFFSDTFQSAAAEERSRIDFNAFENRVLLQQRNRRFTWKTRLFELVRLKRFYIPAATFATAMILFFIVYYPAAAPSLPSAIITSFTGEISSVMIMETPETRQTILWFNEKSPDNGEAHGS